MKKIFIYIFLSLFILSTSTALLFGPDTPPSIANGGFCMIVPPENICQTTGCTMEGDIDMNWSSILNTYLNNTIIYNSTLIGVTLYNVTFNDIIYVNYTQIYNEQWVNITGDYMTGNLNMGDNNITNINYITVSNWSNVTIRQSQIIDLSINISINGTYNYLSKFNLNGNGVVNSSIYNNATDIYIG